MIHEMLTYCRPHGSEGEHEFINHYIAPVDGMCWDQFGNGAVRIGTAPVLFSCHTDTMHHKSGRQSLRQDGDILSLARGRKGLCLGADDGAGVWLLLQMIEAGVSGLYVFHAAEEQGGKGSSYLAEHHAGLLRDIEYAIAFDRKGTTSIITHMMVGRCCSDVFAESLCAKLGSRYVPDDSGTFTDTANYVDLIGECTNISIGYENEHGPKESLNVAYLESLRDTMIHFDCAGLVSSRRAGDIEYDSWPAEKDWRERDYGSGDTLAELCESYPESAARLLRSLGIDSYDLLKIIERNHDETI